MGKGRLDWSRIPPVLVADCWDKVEGFVIEGARWSGGELTPDEIRDNCIADLMQLWAIADTELFELVGIVVTRITLFPEKRVLMVVLAAGRRGNEWLEFVDDLNEFAESQKCAEVWLYGRPGWEKWLKPFGFKKQLVLLQRRVERTEK